MAPAPGVDPAAKYSLQRAHLLRRLAEELAPELQVWFAIDGSSAALGAVPVADESSSLDQH